jgi:hypothetical protein
MYGDTTKTGFGPYLQKFPTNPYTNTNTVKFGDNGEGLGSGTEGWFFDTATGKFSPNDPAHKDL